jgi:flagellar L-ring protein precursor FlgH
MNVTRILTCTLLLPLLAACAGTATREAATYAATLPVQDAVAELPSDGSLYSASSSRDLFGDPKARRVGDILTITLAESTQASKSSSTTTSKDTAADIAAPTILGRIATANQKPLSFGLDGTRSFDGKGDSSQSNALTGAITVTVAQRLSNGALVIRGEKWLNINQGQELVRISGIVRPEDIGPDNTVLSSRVADARIAYTGRGTLAEANTQGWLSRFFNSKWMPF